MKKKRKRKIVCALMGHEIAVVKATVLLHKRHPELGVVLKFFKFVGFNFILDVASNHDSLHSNFGEINQT